jgi:hypothetical protein
LWAFKNAESSFLSELIGKVGVSAEVAAFLVAQKSAGNFGLPARKSNDRKTAPAYLLLLVASVRTKGVAVHLHFIHIDHLNSFFGRDPMRGRPMTHRDEVPLPE